MPTARFARYLHRGEPANAASGKLGERDGAIIAPLARPPVSRLCAKGSGHENPTVSGASRTRTFLHHG